jgi:hypothetical protein
MNTKKCLGLVLASLVAVNHVALALTEYHPFDPEALKTITVCRAQVLSIEKPKQGAMELRLSVEDVVFGDVSMNQQYLNVRWTPDLTSGRTLCALATNVHVFVCLRRSNETICVMRGQVEVFPDGCPIWVIGDTNVEARIRTATTVISTENETKRLEMLEPLLTSPDEMLVKYASKTIVDILQRHEDASFKQRTIEMLTTIRNQKTSSSQLRLHADRMLVRLLPDTYPLSGERKAFLETMASGENESEHLSRDRNQGK